MMKQRRQFLKKVAYRTPTLFILGDLLRPKAAHADFSGGPPPPPGGFFSSSTQSTPQRRTVLRPRKQLKF